MTINEIQILIVDIFKYSGLVGGIFALTMSLLRY